MSRWLALAICCSLLGACATARATETAGTMQTSFSYDVVLGPGQSGRVEGSPLTLTLKAIVDDSRCPEGVDCVWAGDVSAEVRVEGGPTAAQDVTLRLNSAAAREVVHGDHRVTLIAVAPRPKAGQKIEPNSYRASLRVEKR